MAYIGNQPFTTAFLTDQFSGNGSTTAFTLSAAPANTNSLLVAVTGVLQDPSTYSVAGTTLTFSAAPPSGTGNISVRFLGIPASGVVTTAYRTLTEFTATAGQTTFTPPSYTVGYINVFRNGVMLGTADYTASNGTTVVLASAASAGDLVVTESFYVSSVLNALPTSGGTLSGALIVPNFTYTGTLTGSTSVLNIGSGQVYKDASGNVGIGTSSPTVRLQVTSGSTGTLAVQSTGTSGQYPSSGSGMEFVAGSASAQDSIISYNRTSSSWRDLYLQANTLLFGTAGSERARIDSSGNLLVGTTSQARTEKLNVTQSANSVGLEVNCTNASYNQAGVFIDTTRAANSAFQFLYCSANTVAQLFIKGDGGISNYSANNTNLSDERVKTNISLADGYLAKICAIPVKTFNYKSEPEGEQKTLGVIAQDVEAVAPELVNNDGFGELPEDGVLLKTIYQTDLQYALMKCIQEQQALIESLTARIAALENKA